MKPKEFPDRKACKTPIKAIKDNDSLDEIRIRTASYVAANDLVQPFLEAEDKPKSQDRSLLLWGPPPLFPSFPAPDRDESHPVKPPYFNRREPRLT